MELLGKSDEMIELVEDDKNCGDQDGTLVTAECPDNNRATTPSSSSSSSSSSDPSSSSSSPGGLHPDDV